MRIEDYAIIGNCETAALVGRNGSIDWLGLPRFDSAACFAALLGSEEHGHWQISPQEAWTVSRNYRGDSLILETLFETATGVVRVVDCMARRDGASDIIRKVEGVSGRVAMRMGLVVRFDYGSAVPWVTRTSQGTGKGEVQYVVGAERLLLNSSVEVRNENMRTSAAFEIRAGEMQSFHLSWSVAYRDPPAALEVGRAVAEVEAFWRDWVAPFRCESEWRGKVLRSLITLKALTHWQTGGIVAAATTSLPEQIGGTRNWDYRYCWLRDATLTLNALLQSGFTGEAQAWRAWLVRAVAGSPEQLQIMYGLGGERRLDEWQIPWLPGYENSSPVRVGNAASGQVQLDVYGEVLNALYQGHVAGLKFDSAAWDLAVALLEHLETIWQQPDAGIWEMRGGAQNFTHSKVMAWVAFDRMVQSVEESGRPAPLARWRAVRQQLHDEICRYGFNTEMNSFTQTYENTSLDASLLMIPLTGFLPPDDPRVLGTVAAVERALLRDGFVLRYNTANSGDGLPPGEGAFLACSFWLADTYVLMGRLEEAKILFRKLLALQNDVGLLAEEYEPRSERQLGNFPQAFSHIGLVNTAYNLARAEAAATGQAAAA